MTKLTKQERLFDVTQIAKGIFIQRAGKINFSDPGTDISKTIDECFSDAEAFIEQQERHAEKVGHGI